MGALPPMSVLSTSSRARSVRTSVWRRPRSRALRTSCTTRCMGSALSMKPNAPIWTARTQRS